MKILSWNIRSINGNIDGLNVNKLKDVHIENMLRMHDLIFLQETHLSKKSKDEILLPGYKHVPYCRNKTNKAQSASGGLSVFIKEEYRKHVKFLPQNNSDIVWLQIEEKIGLSTCKLFIGSVYIPPQYSSFGKENTNQIWDRLEQDVEYFSNKGKIILCGDFNARTGRSIDYIQMDSNHNYYKLPNNYDYETFHERHSMDQIIQKNGRRLVNICMNNQLYIQNGRTLGDLQGKFTCFQPQGCSVVDYVICSQELTREIKYMKVKDLMQQSDHCPMIVNINIPCIDKINYLKLQKTNVNLKKENENKNENIHIPRFRWDDESRENFQKTLKLPIIRTQIDQLKIKTEHLLEINKQNMQTDKPECIKTAINDCAKDVSNIFVETGKLSLVIKKRSPKSKKNIHNKKWFDAECVRLRKEVKSLLNAINRNPYNTQLRQKYHARSKEYKTIIKRKRKRYKAALVTKLHDMIEENPSVLWNTLQQLRESDNPGTQNTNYLNIRKWTEHLQQLIGTEPDVNPERKIQIQQMADLLQNQNNPFLDKPILIEEIKNAIKKLKNKKSPGKDGITNEMIKSATPDLLQILEKTFNLVIDTGIYPNEWKVGLCIPIYKAGCPLNPENYRGITLTNGIGKLFCQIINQRISQFLEQNNCLVKEQGGFRKNHRTTDHIFILNRLVDNVMKTKNKRLYCCFVDFQKAFDNVWHDALLLKLYDSGITGKLFNIIKSMYDNAHIQTKIRDKCSGEITIRKGVHQGNTISPTLFNVFINDIVKNIGDRDSPNITAYRKIPCLIYADDLVLLSITKLGLQTKLDNLQDYCVKWGLKINVNKTKVIIFTRSAPKIPIHFKCGKHFIEIIEQYKYLGIVFHKDGGFKMAQEHLSKQSNKAANALRRSIYDQNIKPNITMQIFDSIISPILTYGAEIWFPNTLNIHGEFEFDNFFKACISGKFSHENLHTKFCKQILGIHKRAMTLPTLGEMGRYPLTLKIVKQLITFWVHIVESNPKSYIKIMYNDMIQNDTNNKWLQTIQNILHKIGFGHIWKNQGTFNVKRLNYAIQDKLEQLYEQFWFCQKQTYSKLKFYNMTTKQYRLETYLTNCSNINHRKSFCKLRTSSHDLMIEKGRYQNIPKDDRKCKYCNKVEDELHLLDDCKLYNELRKSIFSQTKVAEKHNNNFKISNMLNIEEYQTAVMKYVHECFCIRKQII